MTSQKAIDEIRALREYDESNWRVMLTRDSGRFEAYVPDYEDCIGDDTSWIKTNRLESKTQAELIALVLNALRHTGNPMLAFVLLLKDMGIWR